MDCYLGEALRYGITFKLRKKELLDQYSVDEDDLLGLFSLFNGRPLATIGWGPISIAKYVCYLQDVWQAGVCTAHALGSQYDSSDNLHA